MQIVMYLGLIVTWKNSMLAKNIYYTLSKLNISFEFPLFRSISMKLESHIWKVKQKSSFNQIMFYWKNWKSGRDTGQQKIIRRSDEHIYELKWTKWLLHDLMFQNRLKQLNSF